MDQAMKINNVDYIEKENFRCTGTMPLRMLSCGDSAVVQEIKGKDETERFLRNLGFVRGAKVSIVNELGGNVIVQVKEARVAISKAMTNKIFITKQ